jgi:hypothetical protein
MGSFQVGVASRDITPSPELLQGSRIWLWGYGEDGFPQRMTPSALVRDPLLARAVVIRDSGGGLAVIVAVDLGSLELTLTHDVRARVAASRGIPVHAVCVNVSHTHSAPVISTIPTWWHGPTGGHDRPDPEYRSYVEDQLVGVIEDAFDALAPADLWFGRGRSGINANRHAGVDGDQTLDVVRVSDDAGQTRAVLFAYPAHPTTLDDLTVLSADFPGEARLRVEQRWGGTAVFLQGFGGTVLASSDTASGLDTAWVGEVFAADIETVLNGPMTPILGDIEARASLIKLPLNPIADDAVARAATSGNVFRQRWAAHMTAMGAATPDSLPTQLQYLRVGDWHVLASSHEITTDLPDVVRALDNPDRVTTLGYSNSQLSYLPSRAVLQTPVCDDFPFCDANYEGGNGFVIYAHRGTVTDDVDERLVRGYRNLLEDWQARHGLSTADYQDTFDELTGGGYRPLDVSGYDAGGMAGYTAIWRRGDVGPWVARHGVNAAEFQTVFDQLGPLGYRPLAVSGYDVGGAVRFAGIWERREGPAWVARHGLSSQEYQDQFDQLTASGYRPVAVSGYADGGEPRYAAIWDQRETGPWQARHGLTEPEYQDAIIKLGVEGYRPTWIHGYTVGEQDLYAAVWERDDVAWAARHRLTGEQYQEAFDDLLGQGYTLLHASGYLVSGTPLYAGIWERR